MNYYQPRQRESDGRWDYTRRNDDHIHAVGYCAGWREWKDMQFLVDPAYNEHLRRQHEAQTLPHKDKYHSDGHATPDEASECYKSYLMDQRLRLNLTDANSMQKCQVCGKFTQLFAELDCKAWRLCETHNHRQAVEAIFEAPDRIISSY